MVSKLVSFITLIGLKGVAWTSRHPARSGVLDLSTISLPLLTNVSSTTNEGCYWTAYIHFLSIVLVFKRSHLDTNLPNDLPPLKKGKRQLLIIPYANYPMSAKMPSCEDGQGQLSVYVVAQL